jgi:hypothetical protein
MKAARHVVCSLCRQQARGLAVATARRTTAQQGVKRGRRPVAVWSVSVVAGQRRALATVSNGEWFGRSSWDECDRD